MKQKPKIKSILKSELSPLSVPEGDSGTPINQPIASPCVLPPLDIGEFNQILHLSDIHIRPLLRHDEFYQVFSRTHEMLTKLANKTPSIIVVTGDLFDHKTNFKPETFKVCRDFMKMLTSVSPVILIAGNHDMLENNTERLDAITPIVDDIPGLHYLKYSGIYKSSRTQDCFVVSSLYDKQFITCPETETNAICLFHGTIKEAADYYNDDPTSTSRIRSKSDFNGFKAVLMGDIHKHQILQNDIGGYMAYAGSLIQQNHGEPRDGHGVLVWNRNMDDGNGNGNWNWNRPRLYQVKNDYGFVDIHCDNGEWVNRDEDLPKYCYARLLISNCTQTQIDIICGELKRKQEDGSLVITKKHAIDVNRTEEAEMIPEFTRKDDEIDLIIEQAKEFNMNKDALVKLHKEYQSEVDQTGQTMSSAVWKPMWVEFKNLFGYGNNIVNFIKFRNGLTSISAGNACGKSSIVNAILFGIFGRAPLNPTKTVVTYDVVNNQETNGYIKVLLNHGGTYYLIERRSSRSTSKTTSAELQKLTKFDFSCEIWESNINGDKLANKCDTRQNNNDTFIASLFGDISDFALTNLLNKESSLDLLSMTPADQVKTLKGLFKMDIYDIYRDMNKKKMTALETTISNIRIERKTLESLIDDNANEEKLEDLKCENTLRQGELEEEQEQLDVTMEQLRDVKERIAFLEERGGSMEMECEFESDEDIEEELKNNTERSDPGFQSSLVLETQISGLETKMADLKEQTQDVDWSLLESQSKEELEKLLIDLNEELTGQIKPPKLALGQINKKLGLILAKLEMHEGSCTSGHGRRVLRCGECDESAAEIMTEGEIKELESNIIPLTSNYTALKKKYEDLDVDLADSEFEGDLDMDLYESLPATIYGLERAQIQLEKTRNREITVDEGDIEELRGEFKSDISKTFTDVQARELKRSKQELEAMLGRLNDLEKVVISDKSEFINVLQACSIYEEDDKYRLVKNEIIEKIICNFENESEQPEFQEINHALPALNQRINNLEQIKHNSVVSGKIDQYDFMHNTDKLREFKKTYEKLERAVQAQELKAQIAQHESNQAIQRLLDCQSNRKLIEEKLKYEEMITYYDILEDINITKQNLGYIKAKTQITQIISEIDILKGRLKRQREWERYEYLVESSRILNSTIELKGLKPELMNLQRAVTRSKARVASCQSSLNRVQESLAVMGYKVKEQVKYGIELKKKDTELIDLELELKPMQDYNVLMGNKGIACKLLFNKIKSIESYINNITQTFTKYRISIFFDEKKQTMHIIADDVDNGKSLSTSRFSGYEKLMLQIAFKRALNKYSYNSKSSLIIIDEALDCIDMDNFFSKLPDVMNMITQDYATCLAISQRDISHISDTNMTIRREDGCSRLC